MNQKSAACGTMHSIFTVPTSGIFFVCAFVGIISASAYAEPNTAKMAERCSMLEHIAKPGVQASPMDMLQSVTCTSYISGMRDTSTLMSVAPNLERHCLPDSATHGQVAKIFNRFIERHPEQLHLPTIITMHAALLEAFPCKK